MKRKTRWTLALAILVLLPVTGGCDTTEAQETTAAAGQPAEALQPADEPYTLRIVFSGLVPLVPSDDSASPDKVTVLVPNLDDPSRLQFGALAHPHRNRLLFRPDQVEIEAGQRPISETGWACNCLDQGFDWSFLSMKDEHLWLDVDSEETSLALVRDRIDPPAPCNPGEPGCEVNGRSFDDQARDVQWSVHVDGVIEKIVAGPTRPRLQKALLETTYSPGEAAYPLIRARYVFDRGVLQTRLLHRDSPEECDSDVSNFKMTAPKGAPTQDFVLDQAIAQELELVLHVRGDVVLQARSLADTDDAREPIVFRPKPGQTEVVLRIDNEPAEIGSCIELVTMVDAMEMNPDAFHFVTLYNLLDDPALLPRPTEAEPLSPLHDDSHTTWNGQCSPPTFSAPI